MVEGHCCGSSATIVAPCIDCLAVHVEHILGNLEVANTDIVGVAIVETAVSIEPGIAPAGIATNTMQVVPGTELTGFGTTLPTHAIELAILGTALVDHGIGPNN